MCLAVILCCFFLLFQNFHCLVVYNLTSSTPLLANQTLVSLSQAFEFGFFTPNETTGNQYAGIWFKNLSPPKVVWVANREKPVMYNKEMTSLRIETDGNLKLVDGQQNTIWSTNITINSSVSFVELLDNGNLVLKDINSGIVYWESFNYPCDTLLPGMKIGIDIITGETKELVSWTNDSNPSPGNFFFGITSETPPQAITWKGSLPYYRGGQWDKMKFVGVEEMTETYKNLFTIQQDPQGTYMSMRENSETSAWFLFLSSEGLLKLLYWDYKRKKKFKWEAPVDPCELYGACGSFGICNASRSPICSCLTGFVPKSLEEWGKGNWTRGCIRKTALNCERSMANATSEEMFWKMSIIKLPDSAKYVPDPMDAQQCQKWCLSNCSCQAYSFIDSVGCMIWIEPLMDIEKFTSSGRDLFIRLAHIDSGRAKQRRELVISLTPVAIVILAGLVAYCLCRGRAKQKGTQSALQNIFAQENMADKKGESKKGKMWRAQLEYDNESELPLFKLATILVATNNFSVAQKLGQGGFGPVYWGKLDDGRDVAVKRLSSSSEQGMQEFKNEIVLISKLQHRNLVKLVGWCIQGEEKILVYEYLPNKSLDTYLFDSIRKTDLDWDKRFNIIQGVARGLMYLHCDSCLRVIHRDLKASNILLDEKMNPKISDFGLARIFQGTQALVNTHKVVGTLGYMSPEYALGGIFSEKSDVYSFGVLLLEIVSGKKNSAFYSEGENLNLLSYAWQLWSQGKGLEFMDETLVARCPESDVLKCIHIGLLCVQDHTNDRPNTPTVVLMLSGEFDLPQPKQPSFTCQSLTTCKTKWCKDSIWTTNTLTNSIVQGR